eukprot:1824035-Rhodomonas_salina.3
MMPCVLNGRVYIKVVIGMTRIVISFVVTHGVNRQFRERYKFRSPTKPAGPAELGPGLQVTLCFSVLEPESR